MQTTEQATDLIRTLCSAVGYNIAVWQRGGKGVSSGNRQSRAIAAMFEALTARKPTKEELDAMSSTAIWGG